MNNFPDLTGKTLGEREDLYKGKYLHYQQAETNTSIREGWFYRDDTYQKVRSVDDVFDIYERAAGGNSTFLLNIPPNRDGKFSPADSAVLYQVGNRIKETYGTNLFYKARGPVQVLDGNAATYLSIKGQREIVLSASGPVTINRIVIQEAVATHSERVEKHAVDAWINEEWKEIASATNIGYKRILRFPEISAQKFRVRILQARLDPAISTISAHYYKTRPPQLAFSRDISGMVTIAPLLQDFNWNPHGQNAADNLNKGYTIYYTLDGSEPGTTSLKYEGPFKVEGKEVKAIATDKKTVGGVSSEVFGIIKQNWKLLEANSARERRAATMAFDARPTTYWQSKDSSGVHFLAIDLGKQYIIKGFAYTPQKQHANGMMSKGVVKISSDGVSWQDAESFEFGNLVNDRSTRNHYFQKPINTRYIRIEAAGMAANEMSVAIAELDFFL
jgi:alpha-L-fucosidase